MSQLEICRIETARWKWLVMFYSGTVRSIRGGCGWIELGLAGIAATVAGIPT